MDQDKYEIFNDKKRKYFKDQIHADELLACFLELVGKKKVKIAIITSL